MRRSYNLKLLDKYVISLLIPTLVFSLFICTVVCELVGISFEQMQFIFTEGLPVHITVLVHLLKLPAFICLALPLAFLIATIIIYGRLSAKNELIAFQSSGISVFRVVAPAIALSFIASILMSALQELVVPAANYQAAIVLEREWQVDRTQLAKYNKQNIIYQKYQINSEGANSKSNLEYMFFADRFDGKQMQDITLLKYQARYLHQIITAKTAQWIESKQLWQLSDVSLEFINKDGSYARNQNLEKLTLELDQSILDYANNHRDLREMNLIELYQRLDVIQYTNNREKIREIQIGIQERYALPFSCIVFSFLGSILGTTKFRGKSNSLGIAAIAIIVYYFVQFITTSLTFAEILPIFLGVWLPNLICVFIGFILNQNGFDSLA